MSLPPDSEFKLVEIDGYRERELVIADSLEEIEKALNAKTGNNRNGK
jgi:hypothetical protein